MASKRPLTERQLEVLRYLYSYRNETYVTPTWGPGWSRPMDCGGSDSSYHAAALASLAKRGLAERRSRSFGWVRSAWVYRITAAGVAAYEAWRRPGGADEGGG